MLFVITSVYKGGCVIPGVLLCVSVCLSVCLLATLRENYTERIFFRRNLTQTLVLLITV